MLVPFPILSPPPSLISPLSLQNPNPNFLQHLHDPLFFILDLLFFIIVILSNPSISFFPLFSKLATSSAPSLGFYSLRLMEGGDGGGSKKECSSKASSNDHSSTDQSTDDASSGRFYECIFCKRGFSTAQALGGHMNIHRKDRAKMKHNQSVSKVGEDEWKSSGYVYYNPYLNHYNNQSFYPPVSESLKNYSMFFPVAASLRREDGMRPRELSLFSEHHLHLGLRVHGEERHVVLGCEERRERAKEGEVDLELRLGP